MNETPVQHIMLFFTYNIVYTSQIFNISVTLINMRPGVLLKFSECLRIFNIYE